MCYFVGFERDLCSFEGLDRARGLEISFFGVVEKKGFYLVIFCGLRDKQAYQSSTVGLDFVGKLLSGYSFSLFICLAGFGAYQMGSLKCIEIKRGSLVCSFWGSEVETNRSCALF